MIQSKKIVLSDGNEYEFKELPVRLGWKLINLHDSRESKWEEYQQHFEECVRVSTGTDGDKVIDLILMSAQLRVLYAMMGRDYKEDVAPE